jgi:hypothetical protein
MRKWLRSHLMGLVGAASLLAVFVAAAPAGAREFVVHAHSTERGCNSEAQVLFGVEVSHGDFDRVHDFVARDFNYPNFTPPVPVGQPRGGQCIPGEVTPEDDPDNWVFWNTGTVRNLTAGHLPHYSIAFGKGSLRENEFHRVWKYPRTGLTLEQRSVYGKVNLDRVGRRHHRHWLLTAHGFFVKAQSEGGLIYGGPSTGTVDWKARHRY